MAARVIDITTATIRGTVAQIREFLAMLAGDGAAVVNLDNVRFEIIAHAETDAAAVTRVSRAKK